MQPCFSAQRFLVLGLAIASLVRLHWLDAVVLHCGVDGVDAHACSSLFVRSEQLALFLGLHGIASCLQQRRVRVLGFMCWGF
jgi:hypothetical protein